jgi:hypothetical protein
MSAHFGVHHTFNIGDLAPYHGNAELRSILFKEGEDAPITDAEPSQASEQTTEQAA